MKSHIGLRIAHVAKVPIPREAIFWQIGCECESFNLSNAIKRYGKETNDKARAKGIEDLTQWINRFKPDLFFTQKGTGSMTPDLVEQLRQVAPVIFFWVDWPRDLNPHRCAVALASDLIISESKAAAKALSKRINREVHHVPAGAATHISFPVDPVPKLACDISFIGTNNDMKREMVHEHLKSHVKAHTRFWGSRFPGGDVRGDDFSKVVASSKINLCINRNTEGDFSKRVFTIMAAGGFVLHERASELFNLFEEDREIVYWSSLKELRRKIKKYLNDDVARASIADAGHRRTIREYSWIDQHKKIVNLAIKELAL